MMYKEQIEDDIEQLKREITRATNLYKIRKSEDIRDYIAHEKRLLKAYKSLLHIAKPAKYGDDFAAKLRRGFHVNF